MTRSAPLVVLLVLATAPLYAQGGGTVAGTVRDLQTGVPIADVRVEMIGAQRAAITDTAGLFRLRELNPGPHRLRALLIGYRVVIRDSVLVRAGETVVLHLTMQRTREIDTLAAIDVTSRPDAVLDPMATATTQRITAEEIRRLPVSTVEEAVALSAGTVGSSYRGGRVGQESFIIDGLAVKNQLDASTGGLGLRVPVDLLTEAALTTNGFSARYGQALSGLINVVTKDGGNDWNGRAAYESDRAAPDRWDYGLDRLVVSGDGPLFGGMTVAFAADLVGRLDADPLNAPAPTDPLDPRTSRPNLLPHNSGETYDLAAKLRIPLGRNHTVRLFGLHSIEQRLLFDPALKYDETFAPGRRVSGNLISAHWQYGSTARASHSFVSDLRFSYFDRDFIRGQLDTTPDPRFGAFTGSRLRITGEAVARAQDTALARAPIPGYRTPAFADNTPWGVPAFFLAGGGRGDLAWNHFNEVRLQLDLNAGGRDVDGYFGFEVVKQRVRTFQRALAYQPVGDSAPAATAADFRPLMIAAYGETQLRWQDLAFTVGMRLDRFDTQYMPGGGISRAKLGVSPRLAISTVLKGATVVVSYGRFAQAPDYQYLVDAAFDDTVRTGRFRAGNPSLGYENASQYEFSLRARPRPGLALRLNVYVKRLEGLVASVPFGFDPDSSIFGNIDYGDVRGFEVLFEREYSRGFGFRVSGTLQSATATATNAFQLFRRIRISPTLNDTIFPAQVDFPLDYDRRLGMTGIIFGTIKDHLAQVGRLDLLGGFQVSGIVRFATGLPYSRTNAAGDTILGLPNSDRLPAQAQFDALLRRPVRFGAVHGTLYLDLRNLTNKRNIIALRRDTGTPGLGDLGSNAAAQSAYAAHPEPIPYESPRYRPAADLDADGLIVGNELLLMYQRAARDYYQPLFAYGPPRLVRLGFEVIF
jgi:hypothetical protein